MPQSGNRHDATPSAADYCTFDLLFNVKLSWYECTLQEVPNWCFVSILRGVYILLHRLLMKFTTFCSNIPEYSVFPVRWPWTHCCCWTHAIFFRQKIVTSATDYFRLLTNKIWWNCFQIVANLMLYWETHQV